jgi:hypothetical protein
MNALSRAWWTAKAVNWHNLPRRLLQEWRRRSGLLQGRLSPDRFARFPVRLYAPDQPQAWAQRSRRFFTAPSPQALRGVADDAAWQREVDAVIARAAAGKYLFFSHWYGQLGWPPDFNLDPAHGIRWPVGQHWLGTARSGPPRDDIKLVWESSRFSLAFWLARSYARSGNETHAAMFWEMLDAWIDQNPPQLSVAWACGQEMTFRLIAMLFGATLTLGSGAATGDRLAMLTKLAWQIATHIDTNINQARMQGNNHAISEAVGLMTVGLLFPELPGAAGWLDRGKTVLAAEVARQVADDGSYVQHSFNYHRVMMDDLLWALRLAELNSHPLPEVVLDRFTRAMKWLAEMVDPISGSVPNYGANDGASVLPLSCCDYLDYRPTLQAAWYLLHRRRLLGRGPWDEKMLWVFGDQSLAAPAEPAVQSRSYAGADGGYYVLRGPNSWAMTRCHSFRTRPSQADMLHVDLWHGGRNILRDAGSYMYYCQQPWRHWFDSTAAHNTVTLDGQDQMVKGPQFLWFKWTRSKLIRFATSADGKLGFFAGEHYGYRRLGGDVVHRRSICRIDDAYVVIDDLLGSGLHDVALRWRLHPGQWTREGKTWSCAPDGQEAVSIELACPPGMSVRLAEGAETPEVEGWESLYYAEKTPVPTLIVRGHVDLPLSLATVVGSTRGISIQSLDSANAPAPLILKGQWSEDTAHEVSRVTSGRITLS